MVCTCLLVYLPTCILAYLSTYFLVHFHAFSPYLFSPAIIFPMDIRAGIIAAIILSVIGGLFIFRAGYRAWLSARKLTFYKIRQQRVRGGLLTILASLVLLGLAALLYFFGEPVAYSYFPPSPTITLTPSITLTPTITLSPTITVPPTITDTPSITDTPTITPTPFIPPAIEALFSSVVTPNPNAVFSPLQFTRSCENFNDFEVAEVFQNPTTYICAVFTYDQMVPGAQWTALWYRDGRLVHYDTIPWDGTTGGYGFTEWEAPAEDWLPGTYEVQIFVGLEWKRVGQFTLEGDAPTRVPTKSLTPTRTPSPTRTPTRTPTTIPATATP